MRLSTLFPLICAVSLALAGEGTGSGSGADAAADATKAGSAEESRTTAAASTAASTSSSDDSETSSGGSEADKDDSTAGSDARPAGGKSDGEGGEGTTPIDPLVLTPLIVAAVGSAAIFVTKTISQHQSRKTVDGGQWNERPSALGTLWLRAQYAPLFNKRHSREFRPIKWLNMGVLPLRLEVYLMVIYFVLNGIFMVCSIDWSAEELSERMYGLRNHSGTLATANLIPLVLTVGRNNPLIPLLGVSFDSFNTVHRFLGRLVVVETIVHVAAVVAAKFPSGGWAILPEELWGKELVLNGFISGIMMIALITQAWSPFRHAFYEAFLVIHILLSIVAFVTLWNHLDTLQHQYLMIGVIVAWSYERLARVVLLVYRNIGKAISRATVELLPNDLVRIAVRVGGSIKVRPGQHLYLYMPSIGLWTSHPFSIAWVEEPTKEWTLGPQSQVISLLVKAESGFTRSLMKKTGRSRNGTFSTLALVEGPYGGLEHPSSFGSVVLIAGGVGITHHLLHIRDILSAYAKRSSPVRRITLAWAIRSEGQVEWIQPWLRELLAIHSRESRREDPIKIQVLIYVSSALLLKASDFLDGDGHMAHRAHNAHPSSASSASATPILYSGKGSIVAMESQCLTGEHEASTVETFPHRINPYSLIDKEVQGTGEGVYVSVCGPGGLADDVRDAVRRHLKQREKVIEYYEESFSW